MQVFDAFDSFALWRALPVLVLCGLAFFFGRTLRAGHTPLIERIARVRDPVLTPALCTYTRRLTALWSVYFVVAALMSTMTDLPFVLTGTLVWLGAVVLFVGEHQLRPWLFPDQSFPNLLQQVQDTMSVWRRAP